MMLHTPDPYRQGTSISHLAESEGECKSRFLTVLVMRPTLGARGKRVGEKLGDEIYGPDTRVIMESIGWVFLDN